MPADSNELKLTQQEFTGVPFAITVELLVAAGVTMWGKDTPCIMQPCTLGPCYEFKAVLQGAC